MHAAQLATPPSPLLSPLSVVCDDLRIGRRLVEVLGCPDAPVFLLETVEDADLDGTRRLILWVSNPPIDLLRDRIRRSRPMRRVVMVAPPHRTALFKLGGAEGVPVVGCPSSIEALAERLSNHLGLRQTLIPAPPSPALRAVTPLPAPLPRVSSDQLIDELERSLRRRLGPSAALEVSRPETLRFLVEKATEAVIGELRQGQGSALVSLDDPDDDGGARQWVPGTSGSYRRPTEDAPTKPWPALPRAEAAPAPEARVSEPAASPPVPRRSARPWFRRMAVVMSAVVGVGLALAVHHTFEAELETWVRGSSSTSEVAVARQAAAPVAGPALAVVEAEPTRVDTETPEAPAVPAGLAVAELDGAVEAAVEALAESRLRAHRRRRARARVRAAAAVTGEVDASSAETESGAAESAELALATAGSSEAVPVQEGATPPTPTPAPLAQADLDPGAAVLDPWAP